MHMVQPFILEPDPCCLVNNQERSNEPETLVIVALNRWRCHLDLIILVWWFHYLKGHVATDFITGFRNTNTQISASLTTNGRYVVAASEDSHVYIWKHEADSRPSRSKGVTVTRSYEHFHCQDVSVAIPWPGMADTWGFQDEQPPLDSNLDEVSTANHPPTPVEEAIANEGSQSASGCSNSPLHGIISSASNNYFFDRIAATWPEEKLLLATRNRSPRVSVDFSSNGVSQNMSAWGMVIVTAGLRGEIRTFQNFGLPIKI